MGSLQYRYGVLPSADMWQIAPLQKSSYILYNVPETFILIADLKTIKSLLDLLATVNSW